MSTQRERLIAALEPSAIEGRHIGKSHAGLILHPRQASAIADALLPLIREAQAESLEDAAHNLGTMLADATTLREWAAAYRVGEESGERK